MGSLSVALCGWESHEGAGICHDLKFARPGLQSAALHALRAQPSPREGGFAAAARILSRSETAEGMLTLVLRDGRKQRPTAVSEWPTAEEDRHRRPWQCEAWRVAWHGEWIDVMCNFRSETWMNARHQSVPLLFAGRRVRHARACANALHACKPVPCCSELAQAVRGASNLQVLTCSGDSTQAAQLHDSQGLQRIVRQSIVCRVALNNGVLHLPRTESTILLKL